MLNYPRLKNELIEFSKEWEIVSNKESEIEVKLDLLVRTFRQMGEPRNRTILENIPLCIDEPPTFREVNHYTFHSETTIFP